MANIKKNRNAINQIRVGNAIVTDLILILDAVFEHFDKFFKHDETVSLCNFDCIFVLYEESFVFPEKQFTVEEIWDVIQCCDGSKAPDPYDFNLEFIKKILKVT